MLADLKAKWDNLQKQRDFFKDPEAWGNKFALLESADRPRWQRIYDKAKNELGPTAKQEQVDARAEQLFYLEEIELDIQAKKSIGK